LADIFISYSKSDQDRVRLLAAAIETVGHSVWWDTDLLSGTNFREVIMAELARARAVIVLWTKTSIHSEWVQSEAGRAHSDQKLISIKTKDISYKDIPPPFDTLHAVDINDRDGILAAILYQLGKPKVQLSRMGQLRKNARFEVLSWFGIIGGAISLATHLQGLVTLAKFARALLDNWTSIVTKVWSVILFFVPKVYEGDALYMTFVSFAVVNLLLSCRSTPDPEPWPSALRALRFGGGLA
jgi:hypothetical protein